MCSASGHLIDRLAMQHPVIEVTCMQLTEEEYMERLDGVAAALRYEYVISPVSHSFNTNS